MLSRILPRIKAGIILLFIAAYLLKTFFSLPLLPNMMAFLAVLFFCLGIADIKPRNQKLIFILLFGSSYLIWSGPGPFDWTAAITANAGMVALLLSVPMLSTILYYAPHEAAIQELAKKYIKSSYAFYTVALSLEAFLASLMTLAAIPFGHQLIKPIADRYPAETAYRAITRGFIVNLFWSPNVVTVAVILQYVNITWQQLAIAGIGCSVLAFTIACLFGRYECIRQTASRAGGAPEAGLAIAGQDHMRHLLSLLLQVGLILATVITLSHFVPRNIFAVVAFVAFAIPVLLALLLGKLSVFTRRFNHYLSEVLPRMSDEFLLFLAIGFFGYSLGNALATVKLQTHAALLGGIDPGILSLSGIVAIVCLAMVGVHPIVAISSLSIIMGKIDTGLTNLQLAVTFMTGYTLYLILSPFSSAVMMMSAISGQNVYKMGWRLNWRYALALTLSIAFIVHISAK